MKPKLLLFDLDGTLLRSNKTISDHTLTILENCRNSGIMIGICTSRSEQNTLTFLENLKPDLLISSGGALVKRNAQCIYRVVFSKEETNIMIQTARDVCGIQCEITIDTLDKHYWNYKIDPKKQDQSWGDSVYTDFSNFDQESLKMCVEILDEKDARKLKAHIPECDCIRFSDGFWYKFTKKGVTKEKAIEEICLECKITPENIIAFGDDFADIEMLALVGIGVAMGNAIPEVKQIADIVIGSNDEDGIATYLQDLLKEFH